MVVGVGVDTKQPVQKAKERKKICKLMDGAGKIS